MAGNNLVFIKQSRVSISPKYVHQISRMVKLEKQDKEKENKKNIECQVKNFFSRQWGIIEGF